ncbi:GNAT family N-acetyltransferase [Spiractinospora alimapuensis]|uniref:GNAT family N-acetyltransferase n=1 Tax=Spiractinospora alimapuensis TaxID=2820884 RepID=UPI001F1EF7A7|nr:GNAT family N-acetyltransferase [Spiractinospora alimapuensis]QVQ50035.1 GNAT family N-acetyltransferase [Spiractinospora alimapuensis]
MESLETARLILAPWEDRFREELVQLSADPQVVRFVLNGQTWSREFATRRHQAHIDHWARHGFGWRGMLERGSGEFLGVAAINLLLAPLPGVDPEALEIGWWISPRAWGRGIATEAATAIRDAAFTELDANTLVARVQPVNTGSVRVASKIGMRWVTRLTGDFGESVDVYRLDRAEWNMPPVET